MQVLFFEREKETLSRTSQWNVIIDRDGTHGILCAIVKIVSLLNAAFRRHSLNVINARQVEESFFICTVDIFTL